MNDVFMLVVLSAVVVFAAVEIWVLRKWKGAWRVGAAVPGVAFCLVAANLVLNLSADPASHNMWPFELLGWSVIGLVLLAVLGLARLVINPQVVR